MCIFLVYLYLILGFIFTNCHNSNKCRIKEKIALLKNKNLSNRYNNLINQNESYVEKQTEEFRFIKKNKNPYLETNKYYLIFPIDYEKSTKKSSSELEDCLVYIHQHHNLNYKNSNNNFRRFAKDLGISNISCTNFKKLNFINVKSSKLDQHNRKFILTFHERHLQNKLLNKKVSLEKLDINKINNLNDINSENEKYPKIGLNIIARVNFFMDDNELVNNVIDKKIKYY